MAEGLMEWSIRDTREPIGPGSIVMDGWELKAPLGKGGFSDVWLAEKNLLGIRDQAAVKIIRIPRDAGDIEAMQAEGLSTYSIQAEFRRNVEDAVREIRAMIDLRSHPAIVPCEGFDVIQYEEDGSWEIDIRMQKLDSLANWIRAENIDPEDVIRMGISLSDLLVVCEEKKILHRDIKPANIFVDQLNNFKLGDFGLARVITEAGSMHSKGVGTEAFMAPEVFNGSKYDHRADIYSLGLVMYWLLNRQNMPFFREGSSRSQAIARRLAGEPLPELPEVDPVLDIIIRKACDPDPDKRWKTAAEFRNALQHPADQIPSVQDQSVRPQPVSSLLKPSQSEQPPIVQTPFVQTQFTDSQSTPSHIGQTPPFQPPPEKTESASSQSASSPARQPQTVQSPPVKTGPAPAQSSVSPIRPDSSVQSCENTKKKNRKAVFAAVAVFVLLFGSYLLFGKELLQQEEEKTTVTSQGTNILKADEKADGDEVLPADSQTNDTYVNSENAAGSTVSSDSQTDGNQMKDKPEILSLRYSEEDKCIVGRFRKNGVKGTPFLWKCFGKREDRNDEGGYGIEDNGDEEIAISQGMISCIPGETLSVWIVMETEDGGWIESDPVEVYIPIKDEKSPITVTSCRVSDLKLSALQKLHDTVSKIYYDEGYDAFEAVKSKNYNAAVSTEFKVSDSVAVLLISPSGQKDAFWSSGGSSYGDKSLDDFTECIARSFTFDITPEKGKYTLKLYDKGLMCLIGTYYFNVK